MDEPRKYSFKQLAIIFLIIAVIILAALMLQNFNSLSTLSNIASNPLYEAMSSGNVSEAGIQARNLLSSGSTLSPVDAMWARLAAVDTYQGNATSSSAQETAISAFLETYHAAPDALTRAWIVNRLDKLLWDSGVSTMSETLSQDPEFNKLLASTSLQTVKNIAEYSYSIYPTSVAAYIAAGVSAQPIIDAYTEHGSVNASSPSIVSTKTEVINWLTESDYSRSIEMQYASSSPYGAATFIAEINSYRAYPVSALALIDPSYQSDANATYQNIFNEYTSSLSQNSAPSALLIQIVDSAYFMQAYFLTIQNPIANKAQIIDDLHQGIALVQQYPDQLQQFVAAPQQNAQPSLNMKLMAPISPEYKSFLTSEGWNIGS